MWRTGKRSLALPVVRSKCKARVAATFSNPASVKGTGNAFEGVIGHVIVLDHLYHSLGQANAIGVIGMGQTSFSTSLHYQTTFPAGIQEGVLVLSAPSNANGSIAAAVMQKVLIMGLPTGA